MSSETEIPQDVYQQFNTLFGGGYSTPSLGSVKAFIQQYPALLDMGIDVEKSARGGEVDYTVKMLPLYVAIERKNVELVSLYLSERPELVMQPNEYGTPLHSAAYYSPEITALLIDAGADIEARDYSGATPLFRMAHSLNLEAFLQLQPDLHAKDNKGNTAFMSVVGSMYSYNMERSKKSALLLLEAGADINARDNEGKTALVKVLEHLRGAIPGQEDEETLYFLFENGAVLTAKDFESGRLKENVENGFINFPLYTREKLRQQYAEAVPMLRRLTPAVIKGPQA